MRVSKDGETDIFASAILRDARYGGLLRMRRRCDSIPDRPCAGDWNDPDRYSYTKAASSKFVFGISSFSDQ